MDPTMLNQLGLNSSSLSGSDTVLLEKVFNNISNGKQVKMSPQERNYLMSKLANKNSNQYVPEKDFKDMTPEEKEDHRDMLRKKLREKQNGMKQVRTGGKQVRQNAQTSLQEMLSKIDMNKLNLHAEQVAQASANAVPVSNDTTNTTDTNKEVPTAIPIEQSDNSKEEEVEESLDDFVA